jgi:hypothetical protein
MQAFNLTCKSQFAIVWTCSSSCPWRGVICCCLISNIAAFSLSNWQQATVIRVVTRDRYPQITPSASSDKIHWKELNIHGITLCKTEANKELILNWIKPTLITIQEWQFGLQIRNSTSFKFCCLVYGKGIHKKSKAALSCGWNISTSDRI